MRPRESPCGLRSERGNKGAPYEQRHATVTSPPLGGVSEIGSRQVFGLAGRLLARLPGRFEASAIVSVRSCLPLRGSSGFSPDSLFTSVQGNRGTAKLQTTISWVQPRIKPKIVDIDRKYSGQHKRRCAGALRPILPPACGGPRCRLTGRRERLSCRTAALGFGIRGLRKDFGEVAP